MTDIKIVGELTTTIKKGYTFSDGLFVAAVDRMRKRNADMIAYNGKANPKLVSYHYDEKHKLWRMNIESEYPETKGLLYLGKRKYNREQEALTHFQPYFEGSLHKNLTNNISIQDVYPICYTCGNHVSSLSFYYADKASKHLTIIEASCLQKQFLEPSRYILWEYEDDYIYSSRVSDSVKSKLSRIQPFLVIVMLLHSAKTSNRPFMDPQEQHRLKSLIPKIQSRAFLKMYEEVIQDLTLPAMIVQNWVLTKMPENTEGLKLIKRLISQPEITDVAAQALIEVLELYKKAEKKEPLYTQYDYMDSNFNSVYPSDMFTV